MTSTAGLSGTVLFQASKVSALGVRSRLQYQPDKHHRFDWLLQELG